MTPGPTPEEAFEKLLGRRADDQQKARLYEVRDALGLANNDALWLVLVALEHYDELYRHQPARIAEEAQKVLGEVRAAFAAAAEAEAARSQRSLAEAVAAASVDIATRRTDATRAQAYAAAAAGLVLHGAICFTAGTSLSGRGAVPWAKGGSVLRALLGAPAGWMIFLLLVPVAVHWARRGLRLAREGCSSSERLIGALLAGSTSAMIVVSAAVLWRLF
jgi:hypothetical protein